MNPSSTASSDPTTVTIDLTDATTLAESVSRLSPSVRERIGNAIADTDSEVRRRYMLSEIQHVLTEEAEDPGRTPVAVVFTAGTEHGNGYLLSSCGDVVFDDSSTETIDFGDLDEMLSIEYGNVPGNYAVSVDLRTGAFVYDSELTIRQALNNPRPVKE